MSATRAAAARAVASVRAQAPATSSEPPPGAALMTADIQPNVGMATAPRPVIGIASLAGGDLRVAFDGGVRAGGRSQTSTCLPGRSSALIGQNGGAKSTALKLVAGFAAGQTGGHVRLRGPGKIKAARCNEIGTPRVLRNVVTDVQ